jgi:membrane AbrB-like protein
MRRIAIAQSIRLLILIEASPLIALLVGHPPAAPEEHAVAGPRDLLLLFAGGIAASLVMRTLRLPGPWIMGGLLATALLLLTGTVRGELPGFLVVPCTVCLAALAGSRFRPGDLAVLPHIAGPALGAFAITSAVSAAGALAVTLMFDISIIQTLLAFAPGAQEAVTVLAFQMNVDPAYVAAHQMVRFLALVVAVPVLARWLARRP